MSTQDREAREMQLREALQQAYEDYLRADSSAKAAAKDRYLHALRSFSNLVYIPR